LPDLTGTLEETDVFTVPKNILINNKLRCPMTANSNGRIPVTFGDDIVSECTLPIDPSINSDYSEISKEILKIHQITLNNIEYIARFGNTTVDNAWEWIKMIQPEVYKNNIYYIYILISIIIFNLYNFHIFTY